ncbi:hypothetical protein [Nocardia suismassiliense]|uniref:hypothetical protein n=1 Tax=Nocardia suismassiliense TaxID=2077092 RepID=UPI000D1E2008|nr:hypothetical protein [Nocardia suismassiliense]
MLFTPVEGFSCSAALLSAPLHETDVRAVVAATVHRLRDAYPPVEETAEGAPTVGSVNAGAGHTTHAEL